MDYLIERGYLLYSVYPNTKTPVGGAKWSRLSPEQFIKKFLKKVDEKHFGIRTGNQLKGRYVIGLDFDCSVKDGQTYKADEKTINKYKELSAIASENGCYDGFYKSATSGNLGVLVDITDCPDLLVLLNDIGKMKFNKMKPRINLEILNGYLMILPPHASKCKVSNAISNRQWTQPHSKPVLDLTPENSCYDFVYDYINSCFSELNRTKGRGCIKKSDIRNKKQSQAWSKYNDALLEESAVECSYLDDFLNILKPDRCNIYHNWFCIGCAIMNTLGFENGFKSFLKWSKKHTISFVSKSDCKKYWSKWQNTAPQYPHLNSTYIIRRAEIDDTTKCLKALVALDIKQKTDKYQAKKIQFEKSVCKITQSPPNTFFHWDDELMVSRFYKDHNDLQNALFEEYGKSFIEDWLEDENKRYYKSIGFYPEIGNEKIPKKIYNTFNGFDVDVKHRDAKFNLEQSIYFRKIWGGLIDELSGFDKSCSHFLKMWLGNIICEPMRSSQVMIVLRSEQGIGKGLLCQLMRNMIGSNYYVMVEDPDRIFCRVGNSTRADKLLIVFDEPSAYQMNKYYESIKNAVTEGQFQRRDLYKEEFTYPNWARLMLNSNFEDTIKVESGDRRMCLIEGSAKYKGDQSHFAPLVSTKDDPKCIRWFAEYLKSYYKRHDGYNYDFSANRPMTEIYQQTAENYIDTFYKFISEWILDTESGHLSKGYFRLQGVSEENRTIHYIKTDNLVNLYLGVGGYCDINCIKSKRSAKFVNSHMNKLIRSKFVKRSRHRFYKKKESMFLFLNLDELKKWMVKMKLVETFDEEFTFVANVKKKTKKKTNIKFSKLEPDNLSSESDSDYSSDSE